MIALVELRDEQGRRWSLAAVVDEVLAPNGHEGPPIPLANAGSLSVTSFKVIWDAAGQEDPDG